MLHLHALDLDQAADLLRSGQLVAFPTETVYGLGGDATNDRTVAGIFKAKGRPSFNPLIVHVSDIEMAMDIADLDGPLLELAQRFWPGPLTLLAKVKGTSLSKLVTAGLERVAVRVPGPSLARDLIQKSGVPIAAPSANPSGRISPTSAQHVISGLSGKIAAVLDGGNCDVGLESTIIGQAGDQLICYRPGGLDLAKVRGVVGHSILIAKAADQNQPSAPGQLTSHYAPKAAVRLDATSPTEEELYLDFGSVFRSKHSLSPSGDLTEAAANLFKFLHLLDAEAIAQGKVGIAVAPIPDTGLGIAINDRLRRAAAPR